jgi:hypothetical protein
VAATSAVCFLRALTRQIISAEVVHLRADLAERQAAAHTAGSHIESLQFRLGELEADKVRASRPSTP